MKRAELLATLKAVEPALSTKDLVPIFPCLCFDGTHVLAFDDSVALRMPLKTEFKGGVRGSVVIDWLSSVSAVEIEATVEGKTLKLKAGRSRITPSMLPASEFLFEVPDVAGAETLKMTKALIAGMKKASISIGSDPGHPWRLGLTVSLVKGKASIYGCDNLTASRAVVKMVVPKTLRGKTFILPPRFVDLLLSSAVQGSTLLLTKTHLSAELPNGLQLYSRTLPEADESMFTGLFAGLVAVRKSAVPLPKIWQGILSRASNLLKGAAAPVAALKIKDGTMTVAAESKHASGTDSAVLKGEHEDVSCNIAPELIVKSNDLVDSFRIVDGAKLCLFGPDFTCLVSLGSE